MTWFDDDPALLAAELESLEKSKYAYSVDEAAKNRGNLVIKVDYDIEGKTHKLTCFYPSNYPYFAVRIKCLTFPSGRHLDPYSHVICLIENEQSVWDPGRDNLAIMLDVQIPIALKAHAEPDDAEAIEGNVGYQITGQIGYENNSVVFVDDLAMPDSSVAGTIMLGVESSNELKSSVRGFVRSVVSKNYQWESSSSELEKAFTHSLKARWVKLKSPPQALGLRILDEACEILPSIKTPEYGKHGIDIVALIFIEESEYKVKVYNWIFVIRRRIKNKKGAWNQTVVRCDRFTRENISVRVPRIRFLESQTVLILGLGAIGAHIAWQLARGGTKRMIFVDRDVVQAGNVPRWLLGFEYVGRRKVEAVSSFLLRNFPDVQCRSIHMSIGSISNTEGYNEHEELMNLIEEADIVIDAIAETNVSLYISHLCEVKGASYVWATGTQGAWGGIVGRIIPGITQGSWNDFSHYYAEGVVAAPPVEEGSDVQPVGCFDPTFTGTGFDMDHISLMAARLAVSTLAENQHESYPSFDWDIAVLHLWDEKTALPIAPRWETHRLDVLSSTKKPD